jgi:hypothetical protein
MRALTPRLALSHAVALSLLALFAGCGGKENECLLNTDCPAGALCIEGTCQSQQATPDMEPQDTTPDGGDADAEPADAEPADVDSPDVTPDATPDMAPDVTPDMTPDAPACAPTPEVCDGADNDCDGEVDEGGGALCEQVPGARAICEGEPGCSYECVPSQERCDGVDNDCDGPIDEGAAADCPALPNAEVSDCVFGRCVYQCRPGAVDLNDDLDSDGCEYLCAPASPGPDVCDGADNDCDGAVDNGRDALCEALDNANVICGGDAGCQYQCEGVYVDRNGDLGSVGSDGCECRPSTEICDGVDNDCDGVVDGGCDDDGDGACDAAMVWTPRGLVTCPAGPGDCDDQDAQEAPQLPERCDDQDNNCNGRTDEGCDDDRDGFCDAALAWSGSAACPRGGGDCDDEDNQRRPDAAERCDGQDNDCDGALDQADPDYAELCPEQRGVCGGSIQGCAQGALQGCADEDYAAHAASQGEPWEAVVFFGESRCDGADNNCDGDTDERCCPGGEPQPIALTASPPANLFGLRGVFAGDGLRAWSSWFDEDLDRRVVARYDLSSGALRSWDQWPNGVTPQNQVAMLPDGLLDATIYWIRGADGAGQLMRQRIGESGIGPLDALPVTGLPVDDGDRILVAEGGGVTWFSPDTDALAEIYQINVHPFGAHQLLSRRIAPLPVGKSWLPVQLQVDAGRVYLSGLLVEATESQDEVLVQDVVWSWTVAEPARAPDVWQGPSRLWRQDGAPFAIGNRLLLGAQGLRLYTLRYDQDAREAVLELQLLSPALSPQGAPQRALTFTTSGASLFGGAALNPQEDRLLLLEVAGDVHPLHWQTGWAEAAPIAGAPDAADLQGPLPFAAGAALLVARRVGQDVIPMLLPFNAQGDPLCP